MYAEIVEFLPARAKYLNQKRKRLADQLFQLFFKHPAAFFALKSYSLDDRQQLDPETQQLLIQKGLINQKGHISSLVRELMLEICPELISDSAREQQA